MKLEEIWKDIPNYRGIYQVSNLGRVKSFNYMNTGKEKILKPGTNEKGYLFVSLAKEGRQKYYRVHRLVLMTFQPVENMSQLEVDHINTVRSDNRLENLRWVTIKENNNNPLTRKHNSEAHKGEKHYMYNKFGVKHHSSIPVVQLTLDGEIVEIYGSSREAERGGFTQSNIIRCIKGKLKKHGGYKWEYLYKYLLLKYPKITELNLFRKTYNRKEVNN